MASIRADLEEDALCQVPPIPFPIRESERLKILRESEILDTPPDEAYDVITRLCSRAFQAPICLVSLIDINRQWFKSRVGLDALETPRGAAFCTYAIMEGAERILVVENALEDPRFCNNPLVLGAPNIRFYVGASILVNGVKIGTLCAIDEVARKTPSSSKLTTLIDFADMIGGLIAQRLQGFQDLRCNGVHMHQSVLYILQEPLRHLKFEFESTQRFANQIENQLTAAGSSPVIAGRKLLEYGRKVECFRKGVEHTEKLLDNALRVMIRLQVEAAASSFIDAVSNKGPAVLLPFDPVTWQESMGYLLIYLGLPRWLCDCRVVTTTDSAIESHPDLLLLAVAAILTHLAAISSWSIRSVTIYQSESDQTLIADIVCGGGGLGSDYTMDECVVSESIVAVHRMLSWAHGSLQVVPGLGLHRIILPCRRCHNEVSNHSSGHHQHHHIICAPVVGKHRDENNNSKLSAVTAVKPVDIDYLANIVNNNSHDNHIVNEEEARLDDTDTQPYVAQNKQQPAIVRAVSMSNVAEAAVEAAKSLWLSLTGVARTNIAKVNPLL